MSAFADLHRPGDPLVLPNAWDHASAAALAGAGFPAVGTTSLGVAAALGLRERSGDERSARGNGAAETAQATIDLAHRLTHLPVPVTMDIENGFSTDPAEVAAYVDRLGPVAGVNLEDQLADPAAFAQVLVAVTGRHIFINARVDTYWLGERSGDERSARGRTKVDATLERAKAYVAAGADGIFVPGVKDEAEIARLAEALPVPLNVLFLPNTLSVPRLAELGVARISTGSLLYRVALGAAVSAATAVRAGSREFEAPSYATVNGLART
jgi:2-methylisocitrate lyase-like PEP mutase family enzyme